MSNNIKEVEKRILKVIYEFHHDPSKYTGVARGAFFGVEYENRIPKPIINETPLAVEFVKIINDAQVIHDSLLRLSDIGLINLTVGSKRICHGESYSIIDVTPSGISYVESIG